MGNAIAKKFNLPKEHTATAGHVNNWKIWPGKSKDAGGQLVSIWAFDKTDLTKRKLNPVADKAIVEQVFQIMKRDFTVIKDSKACSNIIQIIEVVEDSKNGIAFTTERIVCSLADVMNNFENVPGGAAEHASFFEAGGALSEMEISRGLLNIALAVQYLHTVQRKLHLNVTPENIVITATGQWKLCGFGFALNFVQGEQQRLASPYFLQAYPITTTSLVSRLEPDLRYAGPECTDGGLNPPGVRYLTPVADVFALGLTFYEIYRYCLKLTGAERGYHKPLVPVSSNDAQQHHAALSTLQGVDFAFLPGGVVSLLSTMMQMNVNLRATTSDIVSNAYFVTGTQAVLNMVETMHTRDLGTQSSQLLSLQPELANFPGRMLIHSILPAISRLCLAAPNLWVYAMPLHAELSKLLPEDKYMYFAGPYLAQGLNTPDLPNETLQVFLASAEFLCRTFGAEFFQANVTTLFCAALEKPNLYLQNLALEKLAEQYVYPLFTAATLVERMMPQLCKQACKNPESTVKIQALYIISLVTFKLEESYIAANILTSLKYIADHEKNPLVSMSVVGNFESISNSLGLQYVATSILPILQGMLLDDGLDKNQFEMVVNMIKRLLKKILDKRTTELGIAPISVAEVPGSDSMDPFANAKSLIQTSKDRNIASNYGMVAGSYKSFSTDRTFNASNVSANSAYVVTAPTLATHRPSIASAPAPAYAQSSVPDGPPQLGPPTATYGSMSGTPAAAPQAPSRAPPPLPSAPPPSHAPPPVPPPSVVSGFGANVGPAATGYGAASSANAPALGTYSSTLGSSAGSTTGSGGYGSSTYGAASSTATVAPTLSAYQSSFASTGSLSTTTSASSAYGTPLTPLDSGLPGFGGAPATSLAGGVPSVYAAPTPAPAVTSLSSGPLGDEPEKKSVFGWFSGSKSKTAASGNKESLMDAAPADLYQPPVVPNATPAYTSTSSGPGSSGFGSAGSGMGSGGGISAGPNDLDDFLSSFGKSAAPSTMGVPNAPSSAYSGNAATPTTPAGATFSANPTPAFRSSFGASTGSYNPTPVTSSYAPSPTPMAAPAAASTAGMTIEQQIAAAQAEIARLSANQAPAQSSAWPTQPATQNFGYGGTAPMAAPAAGGGMSGMGSGGAYGGGAPAGGMANGYGYPNAQGAMPQQGYYGNANMGNMGSAGGYAPPQSGVIPGYSYNPQGGNQMNNMNRGGPGMQQQLGYAAPNAGGYQPPMAAGMPGAASNQAKGKTSDVFDFLN